MIYKNYITTCALLCFSLSVTAQLVDQFKKFNGILEEILVNVESFKITSPQKTAPDIENEVLALVQEALKNDPYGKLSETKAIHALNLLKELEKINSIEHKKLTNYIYTARVLPEKPITKPLKVSPPIESWESGNEFNRPLPPEPEERNVPSIPSSPEGYGSIIPLAPPPPLIISPSSTQPSIAQETKEPQKLFETKNPEHVTEKSKQTEALRTTLEERRLAMSPNEGMEEIEEEPIPEELLKENPKEYISYKEEKPLQMNFQKENIAQENETSYKILLVKLQNALEFDGNTTVKPFIDSLKSAYNKLSQDNLKYNDIFIKSQNAGISKQKKLRTQLSKAKINLSHSKNKYEQAVQEAESYLNELEEQKIHEKEWEILTEEEEFTPIFELLHPKHPTSLEKSTSSSAQRLPSAEVLSKKLEQEEQKRQKEIAEQAAREEALRKQQAEAAEKKRRTQEEESRRRQEAAEKRQAEEQMRQQEIAEQVAREEALRKQQAAEQQRQLEKAQQSAREEERIKRLKAIELRKEEQEKQLKEELRKQQEEQKSQQEMAEQATRDETLHKQQTEATPAQQETTSPAINEQLSEATPTKAEQSKEKKEEEFSYPSTGRWRSFRFRPTKPGLPQSNI